MTKDILYPEEVKERDRNAALSRSQRTSTDECPNCGGKGPHYVPPSFGDKGFFICNAKPLVTALSGLIGE